MARNKTFGIDQALMIDTGLGLGAGVVVPALVEYQLLPRWTTAPDFVTENHKIVAAGVGVILAVPLAMYRGMGPALIAGLGALLYGVGSYVQEWLSGLGTADAADAVNPAPAGLGLLTAHEDMGALRIEGYDSRNPATQGNSKVFGSNAFGGGMGGVY